MTVALVLVRIGLGAVFAIAGVAKLGDREGAARAAREFGLGRFARLAAVTVPLVELALAAALVPATSARFAAAGSALLLTAFVAVITIALAHGRRPDCHCFGKLQSSAAGPGTLLRNAGLAALAVLVAARPAAHAGWIELASSGVALLVTMQAVLAFTLLRRYGRALRRIEELETGVDRPAVLAVGDEAPDFTLARLAGGEVALRELLDPARSLLLVFVDPGCGPCHELVPQLADWLDDRVMPIFISRGDLDANAVFAEFGEVLLQREREVATLYSVNATPSAILVGPDGLVERPPAIGHAAIENLAVREPAPPTKSMRTFPAVATAAAVAGVAAGAAAAATESAKESSDPGIQAMDAALRAAGPRLAAASKRSATALRVQTDPTRPKKTLRARRLAAKNALEAERRQVLALRATLKGLTIDPSASVNAYNARTFGLLGLDLWAQSLQKRERAIAAPSKAARGYIDEAESLFVRAVGSITTSASLLAGG